MGIFDEYQTEGGGDNKYLKGADFKESIKLKVVGVEKKKADNPKYGANITNYLLKGGILAEGETFCYNFLDENGKEKLFNSPSPAFFIGYKTCNPNAGDVVEIKREGEKDKTRYFFSIV